MDFEKYTDRARGFVQSAQSLALREGHQQFGTEHLLKVLLDDPEGLAAGLIDRSGGRSREALDAVESDLAKLPKVSGSGAGQVYLAPALARTGFHWPGGARAAVSLTYDDGLDSQIAHAAPALDAAGLKGTFFLTRQNMEPRFAAAIARAYNDWLHEFCQGDPNRLLGSGMISVHNIDDAVADAQRHIDRFKDKWAA